MLLKIKKLSKKAVMPEYATTGDAGLDLTATSVIKETVDKVAYETDISIEIPKNHVGLLFPRSSIRKYDLSLSNSVGVIDSGYRGTISFTFNKNKGEKSLVYKVGERIGQLVIVELPKVVIEEVFELSDSERGEGSFGSTGK